MIKCLKDPKTSQFRMAVKRDCLTGLLVNSLLTDGFSYVPKPKVADSVSYSVTRSPIDLSDFRKLKINHNIKFSINTAASNQMIVLYLEAPACSQKYLILLVALKQVKTHTNLVFFLGHFVILYF